MIVRSSLLALSALVLMGSSAFAEPAADRRPAGSSDGQSEENAAAKQLPASIDLSGEWRMFLPAGWERNVRIERLGEDRYYVHPPYVMKGTYELRGRELTFISEDRLEDDADPQTNDEKKPEQKAEAGFVWTVRSPYLMTLTGAKPGYRDAVLFRSNGREMQDQTTPKAAAALAPKGSSDAAPTPDSRSAIEVLPQTELAVRIEPGEEGTRIRSSDLIFPVTISNDSAVPIEVMIPGDTTAETWIAARFRPIAAANVDKRSSEPPFVSVYRNDGRSENSKTTIQPGKKLEFRAITDFGEAELPDRRLRAEMKFEVQLSMTFAAQGKLQHATGARGGVITFRSLAR